MNPRRFWTAVRAWLRLWLEWIGQARKALVRRGGLLRPWQMRVRPLQKRGNLRASDLEALMQRHLALQDMEKIAGLAARFGTPESDFFGDPQQVERLIRYLLEQNPPWLYVSRVLSGGEPGAESNSQEMLWREQETRSVEDMTLFIPNEGWRDQPLSSLTLRPTRHLEEVFKARLLEQVLPPEVQIDRHTRGEILIPIRQGVRRRIEFRTETRRLEVTVRKPIPIPIQTQSGSGSGGQLLYVLLDFSASMQGKGATLAMAVIAAVLRANLGQADTRYLFRRYADRDQLWPRTVEPPLQARAVREKDALLDTIFATNFNGSATHINDALEVALADIEHLRKVEQLEAGLLLVTDGRAELLESTHRRLRAANVKLHTVMVSPERHPGLEAVSESFTALDIHPDLLERAKAQAETSALAAPARRRAYRI